MSCEHPTKICILIEGIPKTNSLWKILIKKNIDFYQHNLIPVLFQVYGALHKIRNEFTHYDLHYDNILLTELPNNYFSYNFNTEKNVYNVHSKYMVKIIDYGRSYCAESQNIIKDLCENVPAFKH